MSVEFVVSATLPLHFPFQYLIKQQSFTPGQEKKGLWVERDTPKTHRSILMESFICFV